MGRIMAIDFGTKRMGIAVTDPLKIIASGLTTVDSKDMIDFLEKYFKTEEVECVVVGNPGLNSRPDGKADSHLKLSGNRGGDIAKLTDDFCCKLKKKFPALQIDRIDEFYTSKIARRTIIQSGINKTERKNKSLEDKISATLMLQDYLYQK